MALLNTTHATTPAPSPHPSAHATTNGEGSGKRRQRRSAEYERREAVAREFLSPTGVFQ